MPALTLKRPLAWLPIAMSFAALVVVIVRVLIVGTAPDTDEHTAAHLFQLLMAGQLPLIAFFVIRWFPRDHRRASTVLVLQIATALIALAPVFILHL